MHWAFINHTFGGYPDFMSEEARTSPFDWPALTALNTSNAGAGGALKPANSPKPKPKKRRTK